MTVQNPNPQPTTQFPHPPEGYAYPQPPTKKKSGFKKFMIALTVIGALMIAGIAGCAALAGGAVNEIDKSLKAEEALDKPKDVAEGASFEHDGYTIKKGWTVGQQFGSPVIKGLTVTNVSHEDDWADEYPLLTFTLWKGKTAVAEIEATGNAIQPGESTPMDTYSTASKVPAFSRITVKDMW